MKRESSIGRRRLLRNAAGLLVAAVPGLGLVTDYASARPINVHGPRQPASGFAPFDIGINFRTSSGFDTDPPDHYPVVGNGSDTVDTFFPLAGMPVDLGWIEEATKFIFTRNRSTAGDPRVAGKHFRTAVDPLVFGMTLPATGTYSILIVLGDYSFNGFAVGTVEIFDNVTSKFTVAGTTGGSDYFVDTLGNLHGQAYVPSMSEAQTGVVFASTSLRMTMNNDGASICHLRVQRTA